MNITFNSEKEYHDYMQNHKVTTDGSEIYCILSYIGYLCSTRREYPIRFQQRDCPDFELQIGTEKIGVEHTKASCQALTYGEEKLDDYPEGSMLEIPDCQHITATKEAIKEVIRKPGERLQSAGWGDWGKEKFLIEAILNSIIEKTKKLNQNYEIYPSNEMIVYGNISIPGMRWNYVMPELKKQYTKTSARNFDKIHLIADGEFSYDIMSECD